MSSRTWRMQKQKIFFMLCSVVTFFVLAILGILLGTVLIDGLSTLNMDFITNFPSRFASRAGLKSALYGSVWVVTMTAMIAVPVGVATAIYLEEYAPKNRLMRWIEVNIANLAGIPSVIYGLLGLVVFVRFFGFDRSLWAGALTLSLLVLPVIIIASRGAIASVPVTLRQAALSLGARKWQVVLLQVLPAATPGIMTSVILAMSRVIGETAPLIMIGALSYVAFVPESPSDAFTVLPVQIFNWASRPQEEFHNIAASGIIVLLSVLLTMNLVAVLIRMKFQRYK